MDRREEIAKKMRDMTPQAQQNCSMRITARRKSNIQIIKRVSKLTKMATVLEPLRNA